MEQRIKNYIDGLFRDAPQTVQADGVRGEITANTLDRFRELKDSGMDEEAAFHAAISGIGDIHELLDEYSKNLSDAGEADDGKARRTKALLISLAVALYIISVVPVILIPAGTLGICLMLVIVAAATGLIIYAGSYLKAPGGRSTSEECEQDAGGEVSYSPEKRRREHMKKEIDGMVWTTVVIVYLCVSFLTSAWHISWIIFLIGAAVSHLINAISDYREAAKDEGKDESK